jgi:hypothetical protein
MLPQLVGLCAGKQHGTAPCTRSPRHRGPRMFAALRQALHPPVNERHWLPASVREVQPLQLVEGAPCCWQDACQLSGRQLKLLELRQ